VKILVAYYSRSGNTKRFAEMLRRDLDADIEEIRDNQSHTGAGGYLKGAIESVIGKGSSIIVTTKDPINYDLVLIGTPVWASSPASPVITYIENNKNRFKKVGAFCTMKANGDDKTFQKISELTGKDLVKSLSITEKEMKSPNKKIKDFADEIKLL
jgi:flavodoxin